MTTLDPRWKWMRQVAAFAILLLLWEAAGRAGLLNPLFVPSPSLIGRALYELFADGRVWPHLEATFTAALLGLALGILAGIVLGVVAALLPPVAELLEPVMTLLNAIPRVVLAPLFVIWLGIDLASKVALAFILVAVVIFFTVFNGIRQVDRKLVERVVTLGGGPWDLVRHVYLPSVAARVLGNLKIAVGFAFTGACVGEFVAASRGLGYLLSFAQSTYNSALMFALIFLIMVVVLLIFAIAGRLENICCAGAERACRRDDVAVTDLYIRIREQPREVLDTIAKSLNVRASEPAMQTICSRYMGQIALSGGARVLEIGCGNGATTKLIMEYVSPAQLVGIDPSSVFLDMASETFADEPRVSFALGDAAATGQADASFDLVIAHTVYSHLVDHEGALAEARRVLRPGGQLVIFDGDFATITVALFDGDPLQSAVGAVLRHMMHAPYIMRRLPALVAAAGFSVQSVEPHGYVQTTSPDFLLTQLSRGTNAAARAGEIGQGLVDAFAQEARRRVANGTFYGAILFLSLAARKDGE